MPGMQTSERLSFATSPERYRHWRMEIDQAAAVATLVLETAPDGGIVPGYELKKNSYDLGVYIELNDAVQRLRFSYPSVRAVVLTSSLDRMFCAGANIGMLAQSAHSFKVNFCKFCNETLAAIEDATSCSGQAYIAALNGTAAGGGYELALACDQILLTDDGSSVVALPEVPLLGVLPGTGGLTRLIDKRGVRRDLADVFATTAEGIRGERALAWRLVDQIARPSEFDAATRELAKQSAARSARAVTDGAGVDLVPLNCYETEDMIVYAQVRVELDRRAATATLIITGPSAAPADLADLHAAGAAAWPLAAARELDDAISRLRFAEPELGTWLIKTTGDPAAVLATDELLAGSDDWLAAEIIGLWKRTLRRLDTTAGRLIALIEPGSCFAGPLLSSRSPPTGSTCWTASSTTTRTRPCCDPPAGRLQRRPAADGNGQTRLAIRFGTDSGALGAAVAAAGKDLTAADAVELGLVTEAPDDLDWADEVRLVVEERASFSPDALTGMEANLRFAGPEICRNEDLRPALGLAELDLPATERVGSTRVPCAGTGPGSAPITTGSGSEHDYW